MKVAGVSGHGLGGLHDSGFDSTMGYPGEGPPASTARTIISLEDGVHGPAGQLEAARARARARQPRVHGVSLYFANVSSWSMKAQEYVRHQVDEDAVALVETHLTGKNHDEWKSRVRKWGYRCSGQPALRTYRSDGGTSGGSLVAVSRSLASYGMGPLDNLEGFCCRPEARYWSGRTMRVAGRDVLTLAV